MSDRTQKGVVEELTAALGKTPPGRIDEVLAQAKAEAMKTLNETERYKAYESLFQRQIWVLEELGCPDAIVRMLRKQVGRVIRKAKGIAIAEGHIPFMPAIPVRYMTLISQMMMVRIGKQTGYAHPESIEFTDVVGTPSSPYYLFDVEDGSEMCNILPEDAERIFTERNRRGLTTAELVTLSIHANILFEHTVTAIGSRFGSYVPYICWRNRIKTPSLDDEIVPVLRWHHTNYKDSSWGIPSCSTVLLTEADK